MAVNIPGLSSLGVKLGYAVESTIGSKPANFVQLERCNSIGGITIETETIDASALEDLVERTVAGRGSTGGSWEITFNLTSEVYTQLTTMMTASAAGKTANKNTWFEVWVPSMTKAFFVIAEPPSAIPMPEFGQNQLQTVTMTFAINEYKGMDQAVEPQPAA